MAFDNEYPHSIEAEQAVIGGILLDGSIVYKVLDMLDIDDFYAIEHKEIMKVIKAMALNGEPIDVVSVTEALQSAKTLDMVGGASYLLALEAHIPNVANIEYYIKIVQHKALQRRLMDIGFHIYENAYKNDLEAVQELARTALMERVRNDKPFSETFTEEDYKRLAESKRFYSPRLQKLTRFAPFMRGENIYIAGRTSTGKTQLALNLALDFLEQGAKVGYISMELGREQLLIRLINWEQASPDMRLADIDIRKKEVWEVGMNIISQPKYRNFYFVEEYNRLGDIVSWIESHTFDVVFVDYIQLVYSYGKDRVRELGEIAKEFRRLSKQRCMVILSQFNRRENDDETEIDLSRIRDSGEIEQTATTIIIVRRSKENLSQFHYAIAKNQTYGALSKWIPMRLRPNGEFVEEFEL